MEVCITSEMKLEGSLKFGFVQSARNFEMEEKSMCTRKFFKQRIFFQAPGQEGGGGLQFSAEVIL